MVFGTAQLTLVPEPKWSKNRRRLMGRTPPESTGRARHLVPSSSSVCVLSAKSIYYLVYTPTLATHLPTRTPLKPLASKLSIGYLHRVAMVVVNSNPGQCVSYLGETKEGRATLAWESRAEGPHGWQIIPGIGHVIRHLIFPGTSSCDARL